MLPETIIFERISELKDYLTRNEPRPIVVDTLSLNLMLYFYLQRGVKPTKEQMTNLLKAF